MKIELNTLGVLCAASAAMFFNTVTAEDSVNSHHDGGDFVFDLLREGGFVLVMRHADSPHNQVGAVGLSEGCRLQDGRGLSAKGFVQARQIGELLAEQRVPVLKAYTSRMCRAWDTAALAAAGAPVLPNDSQMTTNPGAINTFKSEIEAELAANPGSNIALVSHSNIAPLYGAIVRPDENELPQGAVSIVRPASWNGLDGVMVRINPSVSFVSQSVTVE